MTRPRFAFSTTPPSVFPVTLVELKAHLRLETADNDTLLGRLLKAGCEAVERRTGRIIPYRTVTMWMDRFPRTPLDWWNGMKEGSLADMESGCAEFCIPMVPIIALTAITTYNPAGTAAVFSSASYSADIVDRDTWARVTLNEGYLWPVDLRRANAIKVEFTAGYVSSDGNTVTIPEGLKNAIFEVIAWAYANRGDCNAACDGSCASLLRDYIIRAGY
jgi:hypothetical protein